MLRVNETRRFIVIELVYSEGVFLIFAMQLIHESDETIDKVMFNINGTLYLKNI